MQQLQFLNQLDMKKAFIKHRKSPLDNILPFLGESHHSFLG